MSPQMRHHIVCAQIIIALQLVIQGMKRPETSKERIFFFWVGMKSNIRSHIKECDTCQIMKVENTRSLGLLQLLPILERIWSFISMDIIEGLPVSKRHIVIMVVIDRLSKYSHFIPIIHP